MEVWTSVASLMGVWAFAQTILHTIFPPELRFATVKYVVRLFNWASSYCYYDITEIDGVNTNELYNAVQLYLSSSASVAGNRVSLTRGLNSSRITYGLSNNDRVTDIHGGAAVVWEHVVTQRQSQSFSWRPLPEEKRGFTLKINKKDKSIVLESYLNFIMQKATEIRRRNQDRNLYTNSRGGSLDGRGQPWESVPFKHPSTFETLALDPDLKSRIMEDLKDFADGETFYRRTGRAWKRGYLLYGPPGTGKSSMIAAMANYLGYDIYDLELTEVHTNSELRKLLMKTSSKSIIVIEDIDCSVNLTNRKKKSPEVSHYDSSCNNPSAASEDGGGNSITLSGLLNFTDGLWSCCGSEKIFVFTTNHIEKLDPALLRCGRMDVHIFMSYCSFSSLKILLRNYLACEAEDLEESKVLDLKILVEKAKMTPADISEILIKNRRDRDKAIDELLEVFKKKFEGNCLGKSRENNVDDEEEQEKRALENPIEELKKAENVDDVEKKNVMVN